MSRQPLGSATRWSRGVPIAALALLAVGGSATAGERAAGRLEKGKFLVASRALQDPRFAQTVVLLVEYNADGALGVIVNRPTEMPLGDALPEVKELARRRDVVYLGGPVARERMLVLLRTRNEPPESLRIFGRVFASGSLSALRHSVTRGDGVRAYAGYTGWGAGQLDREVARGDWLIGPADVDAVFAEHPTDVWDRLIERFAGEWAMATGLVGQ
jgi:putative transcriptional regulator